MRYTHIQFLRGMTLIKFSVIYIVLKKVMTKHNGT